jgi:hypothetical protein
MLFSSPCCPTLVSAIARQKLERDVYLPQISHPAPVVHPEEAAQRQSEFFVVKQNCSQVALFIPAGLENYFRESVFRFTEVMNCLEGVETVRRAWMKVR